MCALHVFLGKTACSYNFFFLILSSASGDEPDEIGKTLLTPCSEADTHQEDDTPTVYWQGLTSSIEKGIVLEFSKVASIARWCSVLRKKASAALMRHGAKNTQRKQVS